MYVNTCIQGKSHIHKPNGSLNYSSLVGKNTAAYGLKLQTYIHAGNSSFFVCTLLKFVAHFVLLCHSNEGLNDDIYMSFIIICLYIKFVHV